MGRQGVVFLVFFLSTKVALRRFNVLMQTDFARTFHLISVFNRAGISFAAGAQRTVHPHF